MQPRYAESSCWIVAFLLFFFGQLFHGIANAADAIENLSNEQATQSPPQFALFDEDILADNVFAVRRRSAGLSSDNDRFDCLVKWVLPSETHPTIRMGGAFTPTHPAPIVPKEYLDAAGSGGTLVSPVFDLLKAAKKSGRLQELLRAVEAIPESADEEQQRAKTSLLVLIHLEMGQQDSAATAAELLLRQVIASKPQTLSDMWPETLVVHRAGVDSGGHSAVHELLAYLFANRSQRDLPRELPAWHHQIASLAGRNGHLEVGQPESAAVGTTSLTQWIPFSRVRHWTRGRGFPQAEWAIGGDRVDKISGHDEDYLFFRSPLLGDYEIECDLSSASCQALTAGTIIGNDYRPSHLWAGTVRNGPEVKEIDFKFTRFDPWVYYRSTVRDGICTTWINGQPVHTETLPENPDPWFAVRSWSRSHASARDIRISGNPRIPDRVNLSASDELCGWIPYHGETAGTETAEWQLDADPESTGIIVGRRANLPGTSQESLLYYQRPLEQEGTVEYEFFYQPGSITAHPALDRMALILQPDGVRIHWITDDIFDASELAPDNLNEEPQNRRGPDPLPLLPNAWNRAEVAIKGLELTLRLNGQAVFQRTLEPGNRRTFGFFHYSDATEARVRRVFMSGNWPKEIPSVADQELADSLAKKLDAERQRLAAVFTHDFAANGMPPEYFFPERGDGRGTLQVRPDGVFVARPSFGDWNSTGLRMPLMLRGDFDVEAEFDQLTTEGEQGDVIMLVLHFSDAKQQQCRLLRVRTIEERQQLHVSFSALHESGGRSYGASRQLACEARRGRLRLCRRGATIHYLFAENDSDVFRVVGTEVITDAPTAPNGIELAALRNGTGTTSVVWKSVAIRAERILIPPDPSKPPQVSLYSTDSDGANVQLLAAPLKGFTQAGSPEWSSDGQMIVCDMSQGGTATSHVIRMNADGSNAVDLGRGCMPSLSSDGQQIVFSMPGSGVMKMNSDGTSRETLDRNGWGIQWSPDGTSIAWAVRNNLIIMDAKSGEKRPLLSEDQATQLSFIYWNPGWSHDSKWIAFKSTTVRGLDGLVAVANVDSTKEFRILYEGPNRVHEDLTWHPDSQHVVFSSQLSQGARMTLVKLNRSNPAAPEVLPGQNADWDILDSDWSPDGRHIVFAALVPPEPVDLTVNK